MTYPPGPPGSPGYPPAQQPTTQFAAPTQQFGRSPDTASTPQAPSALPMYLTAAVAFLGLAVYLAGFGPLFTASTDFFTPGLLDIGITAAILAGLLAGVALLPRQRVAPGVIAALSVLSFLLVIAIVLTAPAGVSADWGLYLIIAFTVLQSVVAVAALLYDAGVITPPAPRPKYDQQYGQYGYYGQPSHGGPHQQQGPGQQRPGYPSPYGYPGGYNAGPQQGQQSGPPTPPTGFPAYGQPPSNSAPTTQTPAQSPQTPTQQESPSPSAQSAPPPS
ncbi:DUF5336 domain-containing protein [Mycolicibacterium sp. XJ1819]